MKLIGELLPVSPMLDPNHLQAYLKTGVSVNNKSIGGGNAVSPSYRPTCFALLSRKCEAKRVGLVSPFLSSEGGMEADFGS